MRRPSNLTLALVAGAVLLVSVIAFKRYLPYTGMNLAPQKQPDVVLTMENAYLVGFGSGGRLWSIRAGSVELAQNRFIVTLAGIHDGRIYDRGKVALKLRAGRAAYNIYAKDLTLSDGILIEGNEGQRISAPGATWNSFSATLRSSGGVAFESNAGKMTAETLVVDIRKREMSMWDVAGSAHVKAIQDLGAKDVHNAN